MTQVETTNPTPAPAPADAEAAEPATAPDANAPADALNLTDFMDMDTLREMQASFTALTRLPTVIRDANGQVLVKVDDVAARVQSDQLLDLLIAPADGDGSTAPAPQTADPTDADAAFEAPIVVDGQRLGAIAIEPGARLPLVPADHDTLRKLAGKLGVEDERIDDLVAAAEEACGPNRATGVQFLYLLANSVAQLCYQQHQLERRIDELGALYQLGAMFTGQRDLQQLLETAARSAAQVMRVKGASIRLLDPANRELVPRAIYNLSDTYIHKGPIPADRSEVFQQALRGEVVEVHDLAGDPRVLYPQFAQREGLVSMMVAGMVYQGRRIGTVQVFTDQPRRFTDADTDLLRAVAQLLGAAIENARLDAEQREASRVQHQVRMAAKVQSRMLPHDVPHLPPFDIAARYVPSMELGGDFYDFIDLEGNLGIAVGDVVGKGIAASLLMASVRASLRAYAQDVYDLDEIIARVNVALTRDTLDNEFATLFYGVLDPQTHRLTYSNAGHEPPLLMRGGELIPLDVGGMIVGIDHAQQYDKSLIDLEPEDVLVLYTDGLLDALNFKGQRFGRQRIRDAVQAAAGGSAQDILNHILWEMRRFVGLNSTSDDTTIVVVRVGG